ncbi:MAG: hypothetical protein AAF581_18830 [Planctomycetota bacterium]
MLSFLHPIEPLIAVGSVDDPPCLDRRGDGERTRVLPGRSVLASLIDHPRVPDTVLQGVSNGVWRATGQRAIYLVWEQCLLDGGVEKSRWSIVAGVDPEMVPFRPAVSAPRDAVARLTEEIRVAGVDPVGAVGLYRDEENQLEKLVEARKGKPPLVSIPGGAEGGEFRIWALEEEEGHAVSAMISQSPGAIVGDVASYRAVMRARDHANVAPSTLPVVQFFNQREFGVVLTSTLRAYSMGGVQVNDFALRMHEFYEVREQVIDPNDRDSLRRFLENVRMEGVARQVVGVVIRGIDRGFIVAVPDDGRPRFESGQPPEVAYEFDAEWVERGMVDAWLPDRCREPISVVPGPDRVATIFAEQPQADVAFVLNPPPKRHIMSLGHANWRLPHGSLQLKPAVARGLFLCPLQRDGDLVERSAAPLAAPGDV